jgi:Kef-type K+ transport system membrane component KefB
MDSVFSGLSLIIVIAAAISLVMKKLRQPLMVGHIITGILVGPVLLNVTKDPGTLKIFADLGIALLLFIIGLGMNPKVVREVGKASVTVGVVQVGLTTFMGWIIMRAIGFTHQEALFLGFGFAISSTIVALKLLNDRRYFSRRRLNLRSLHAARLRT